MSARNFACGITLACLALGAPALAQSDVGSHNGTGGSSTTGSTGSTGSATTSSGSGSTNTAATNTSSTGGTASSASTTTSTSASTSSTATHQDTATADSEDHGLMNTGTDYSLGWRVWAMTIPAPIVGLFVHLQNNWAGSLGIATGPEFVYRSNGIDVVFSLMYTDYSAPEAYFRANNDPEIMTERVQSQLWGAYFNVLFLRGFRLTEWFEFQLGAGVGVGYIGGNLYRSQAYQDGSGAWRDCVSQGGPGGAHSDYCMGNNDHYTQRADGTSYTEPGIFKGGDVPTVIPWISLPHVALHFQPIHNLDLRIEGGFALIGFYGGAAAHFVF